MRFGRTGVVIRLREGHRLRWAFGVLCVITVALFSWVQASGNFPDPDGGYHGRMALLISERGPIHDFPWLAKTVFADSYVDHHFLYHVLLIPFVTFAPTLAEGMRLSAIVFAVVPVLAAPLVLRKLGVGSVSFVVPILMLVSHPLVFRLNLARVPSLSLFALLIGFYAATRMKARLLAFVAFGYVWLYDGWILLPIVVVLTLLADGWVEWRALDRSLRDFGRRSGGLLGAMMVGLLLGHVVNPYFPENIAFEWLHIVQIGFLGFRDQIGVGGEWYPYPFGALVLGTPTTFIAAAGGAAAFLFALVRSNEAGQQLPKDRLRDTVALALFAAFMFVFTLRSKRNVEYFVPFTLLAAASAWDLYASGRAWAWMGSVQSRTVRYAAALFVAVALSRVAARDLMGVRADFDSGSSPTKYSGLSAWLAQNTPDGTLVWHNDWDDFPFFFAQGTNNRWLVGLDPAFWFVRDPERFQEWVDMTQSRITDNLAERIVTDFGSHYAFVDRDHRALEKAFSNDPRMIKVYGDGDGTIFFVE